MAARTISSGVFLPSQKTVWVWQLEWTILNPSFQERYGKAPYLFCFFYDLLGVLRYFFIILLWRRFCFGVILNVK